MPEDGYTLSSHCEARVSGELEAPILSPNEVIDRLIKLPYKAYNVEQHNMKYVIHFLLHLTLILI